MSKLKLMSVLQSRLSRRSYIITRMTEFASTRAMKAQYKRFVIEQKEDKTILKQLVEDERELKLLRECAKNLQGRIDTLLGWNK